MNINKYISELLDYGTNNKLLKEEDRIYSSNLLLDILRLDEFKYESTQNLDLETILSGILEYAIIKGLIGDNIVEKDLFDTKIMNTLLPRPSEVNEKFFDLYKENIEKATDYYYDFSKSADYIRTYRIKKDIKWKTQTEFGDLDITINLSKPEKDPKAIALAGQTKSAFYPKCLLCKENEGYAGRFNHPARQNLRLINLNLAREKWFLQYSPYVYYNEHCIVFSSKHSSMKINRETFEKLFDFVRQFPHYILGSNADLPIVGGSILSHEHFQGGKYEFPMAKANIKRNIKFENFEDVEAGIVDWPLSVIRLSSKNINSLIELSEKILNKWISYSDEKLNIFAYTGDERHNTITPIVRFRDSKFEIDLVLRNNICTEERPDGLYHPRQSLHNIKKENIGLIEVMGLAILPSRLKTELNLLKEYILENKDISSNDSIKKHYNWSKEFLAKYDNIDKDNIDEILQKEVGLVFLEVLKDAGVYKLDVTGELGFLSFVEYVNR